MTDPRIQALLTEADFHPGAVTFTNWERLPWDSGVAMGIGGDVAVVSSTQALGFEISGGGHANWVAVVRGMTTVHVVPGCRVGAVSYGTKLNSRDYVWVP